MVIENTAAEQVLMEGTGLEQSWHPHVTVGLLKKEDGIQESVKIQENGMGGPWSAKKVIKIIFV